LRNGWIEKALLASLQQLNTIRRRLLRGDEKPTIYGTLKFCPLGIEYGPLPYGTSATYEPCKQWLTLTGSTGAPKSSPQFLTP
jgi:hypothetical protein